MNTSQKLLACSLFLVSSFSNGVATPLSNLPNSNMELGAPKVAYTPGQKLTFFNSVKNEVGATAVGYSNPIYFWQIPYASRLQKKGVVSNSTTNYYNPTLYTHPQVFQPGKVTKFIDEIWDLNNKKFVLLEATATGVNLQTMQMLNPVFISGDSHTFDAHFAGGWGTYDHETNVYPSGNCTAIHGNIMQYIESTYGCSSVHVAGFAGPGLPEDFWGPRVWVPYVPNGETFQGDGTAFSKINRYRRSVIIPE